MKRWQFRAPCLGVFPKCHFINHRMDLPISRFLPDYIDTEHIIEITPAPAYIYHDEHPPSERLIRNAKEMFWHWHVTYVWTLWPGEDLGWGGHRAGARLWWMSVIRMTQRPRARLSTGSIRTKIARLKQWVLLSHFNSENDDKNILGCKNMGSYYWLGLLCLQFDVSHSIKQFFGRQKMALFSLRIEEAWHISELISCLVSVLLVFY